MSELVTHGATHKYHDRIRDLTLTSTYSLFRRNPMTPPSPCRSSSTLRPGTGIGTPTMSVTTFLLQESVEMYIPCSCTRRVHSPPAPLSGTSRPTVDPVILRRVDTTSRTLPDSTLHRSHTSFPFVPAVSQVRSSNNLLFLPVKTSS